VPGDAAAQVRGDAIESPDRVVKELLDKLVRCERATVVLECAGQNSADGKEDENDRQSHHTSDRTNHEGISAAPAPRGEAVAEQHQERCRGERGAKSHAGLTWARRAERGAEK